MAAPTFHVFRSCTPRLTSSAARSQRTNAAECAFGTEFYLGGKLVKDMPEDRRNELKKRNVMIERDQGKLLKIVAERSFGG